jgi:hypothetical protein
VSEAHGGVCPKKKCGANTSIKTNDSFVLDCIAFIHQQALACNHNFQLSLNSGAADHAAVEYRCAMMQCRGTCLQSLHQLVQRAGANIKSAAPDLRLDLDSLMSDEDDTRTMPERLFDEYSLKGLLFTSLIFFQVLHSKVSLLQGITSKILDIF